MHLHCGILNRAAALGVAVCSYQGADLKNAVQYYFLCSIIELQIFISLINLLTGPFFSVNANTNSLLCCSESDPELFALHFPAFSTFYKPLDTSQSLLISRPTNLFQYFLSSRMILQPGSIISLVLNHKFSVPSLYLSRSAGWETLNQ